MFEVFRFNVYDASTDEYVRSTRMATLRLIEKLNGVTDHSTRRSLEASEFVDGLEWTRKGYPDLPIATTPKRKAPSEANHAPGVASGKMFKSPI
jgi:hypothetical protein